MKFSTQPSPFPAFKRSRRGTSFIHVTAEAMARRKEKEREKRERYRPFRISDDFNDLGNNGLDVNSIIKIKDLTKNKDKNKGAPAERRRTQEQMQAQRTNTVSVILIAVIMGLNVILASFADHTSFKKPVERYTVKRNIEFFYQKCRPIVQILQVFPCNNNATISFTATLKARRDLIISDVEIKVSFKHLNQFLPTYS